jgi:hypothetical protein
MLLLFLLDIAMGAVLPVYMLNINRTVISPQINATTDNFYQVWLGSPPNTVYLRAGDLTEKDCFTVWQPFNAGGSGMIY